MWVYRNLRLLLFALVNWSVKNSWLSRQIIVNFSSVSWKMWSIFLFFYRAKSCKILHLNRSRQLLCGVSGDLFINITDSSKEALYNIDYTQCPRKTVQNCFCQNFVKFLATLILFCIKMAKRLELLRSALIFHRTLFAWTHYQRIWLSSYKNNFAHGFETRCTLTEQCSVYWQQLQYNNTVQYLFNNAWQNASYTTNDTMTMNKRRIYSNKSNVRVCVSNTAVRCMTFLITYMR